MERSPLLVVGSLAYDEIETAYAKGSELLGGSVSHFSLAAALCGALPRIVAVVGDDFGAEDLDFLAGLPADITGIERREGRTFRWGGRYSADFSARETLFTELGVFEDFRPRLSPGLQGSPVLFLANIHPALQAEVLDATLSPDFVALDTMNLWIDTCPEALAAVIARVDLLFINDEEARQLSGESSLLAAGRRLLAMGPVHCLLKKGEHGALLFSGEEVFPFPSFPTDAVVDPTGAGDSFAGGVMGELAREGRYDRDAIRRALVTGSVTGSFAVEGLGLAGLSGRSPADLAQRRRRLLELLVPPEIDA